MWQLMRVHSYRSDSDSALWRGIEKPECIGRGGTTRALGDCPGLCALGAAIPCAFCTWLFSGRVGGCSFVDKVSVARIACFEVSGDTT